jgi:hypothetical protein
MVVGISVGAPIAAKYYDLTISNEVGELFFLLPIIGFWGSIPLCMLAAAGSKYTFFVERKFSKLVYVGICTLLIPLLFYGVSVWLYYRN